MKHAPGAAACPHTFAMHVLTVHASPSSMQSPGITQSPPPAHVPPRQAPETHIMPHVPQLSGSVSRFDSHPASASQSWSGSSQVQTIAMHDSLASQTVPHDPQNGAPSRPEQIPAQHTDATPHDEPSGSGG